ncbi:PAS domain S-box protein [Microcoleus sp. herbarium7]|uniref:PAS domain S-box protein n=1 Tax=Microcoleus sp. herbarium7 TaxID=3055435 RepID=UPI002FD43069
MGCFSLSNGRFRLLLLVFFTVIPVLGLVIYSASKQQRRAHVEVEQNTQRLTQLAASNQDQLIEKVRQFLILVSQLPELQPGNSANCSALLTDLAKQDLPYANFGVAELDGDIVCSDRPLPDTLNVSQQSWFEKTIQTNGFTVGGYQNGRITSKDVLVLSYPVRDAQGNVQAVLFGELALDRINQLAAQIQLPKDETITIIDQNGTILARHPHPEKWVGKSLPNTSLIKTILTQGKGSAEIEGLDGIRRLYAFTPLNSVPNHKIYLSIGISKTAAFAKANQLLWHNIAETSLIGLLILAIVVERTIELKKANGKLQIELSDRQRVQEALRESEERFRSAFDDAAIGMALVAPDGRWLQVNRSLCALLGYSEQELLATTFQAITHPDDLDTDLGHARQLLAGKIRTYQMEKRYFHKLGYIVWILLSISLIRDARGEPLFIAQIQDITQRKQAEEALSASQARLAGILDIAKDAIISIDKNQQIILFNQGAEKIFGYTTPEILGKPLDILLPLRFAQIHHQHVVGFRCSNDTARKMGDRSEVFGRRKDGTEFPAEASISKLEWRGETIFTVILRDITERKRAEEARFQLAAIVESSEDAIIGKTLDGVITSWNSGAQRIYGYLPEEVKGRYISILMPPNQADEMPQILEKIRQGKRFEFYETVRMRKDGEKMAVSLSVSPIKDAEGRVIGVSSIVRDITERKRVQAALARLGRQNELILNAAGEGIYGLDLEGKATFINQSAARMLGYEPQELIDRPMHSIVQHSKPDGTFYPLEESPIYAAIKDGAVHQVTNQVFWRKDGSSFPVEYVSTPIQEQNKIVGAVVTFKNITERRAIEQMKNEFISVVSHELRTPLTSMNTSLELLASGLLNDRPQKVQSMLEVAMESTNRLMRLVNNILDIERIEAGKVTIDKEICDLADLMVQVADSMQAMAQKAGVILSVTPTSDRLWADPDRIIQTLTNLLSNAIKFSPEGATVWLTAECQCDRVQFQIKDRGRGIPADKLESIFGRFQQVDASDSRQHGGTGLGLAICRSIVQQHGGRIWAESVLGEGSTFHFTLPRLKDNESMPLPGNPSDRANTNLM